MSELGKPFLKKIRSETLKKKINVKTTHVDKNHQRKIEIWLKQRLVLERTMDGFEKPFRKQSDPNNRKNSKKTQPTNVGRIALKRPSSCCLRQ